FFWLTLGDKKFTDHDQLVAFVGLDVKARQSGQSASKRSPSAATVSSLRVSIARPKQQSSRLHIACCILVIIGLAHHTETYRCSATADHRMATGIHVGFRFVMIQAPPNATSPAYTICGSIAMSAETSPTIAPSTDCTAFSRSFATL